MQLLPVALTHISCLAPSHLNIWLQDPDTESSVCVGLPSVQITESPRKITVIIETKPATSIQQPAGSSLLSLRSVSAEAFHWNDQTLAQCTALPTAQAAVTRNAKWISRLFCLHIIIVISELIGNGKDWCSFFHIHILYRHYALQPLTLPSLKCIISLKEMNIEMYPRSLDWPLIGQGEPLIGLSSAFVRLSSHHPWQGIGEHILPMYLLLSSHRETDYKNPQKTLHIYISVCHNSLGLGPSFYKSHRNIFPV